MKLTVEVDAAKLLRAFQRSPEAISRELRVEMKQQMSSVAEEARTHHRFISRRGGAGLEGAVSSKASLSGLVGKVFIDTARAIYGPRIHRGWGSWSADRFVFRAFRKKSAEVIRELEFAILRGFRKVGL